MTLVDEIRRMNDEQLAAYMAEIFTTLLANMDAKIISNWLAEILRQEVEE